jgi:hypothetical protein
MVAAMVIAAAAALLGIKAWLLAWGCREEIDRRQACHHFVNDTWLWEEALRARIVQLDEAEVHRYRRKHEQQSAQGHLWAGVIQE